jgi:hypothetical protein
MSGVCLFNHVGNRTSASARISKGKGISRLLKGKGQGAVLAKKGNLRRTRKNLKNG